jgi:hypothetical protein
MPFFANFSISTSAVMLVWLHVFRDVRLGLIHRRQHIGGEERLGCRLASICRDACLAADGLASTTNVRVSWAVLVLLEGVDVIAQVDDLDDVATTGTHPTLSMWGANAGIGSPRDSLETDCHACFEEGHERGRRARQIVTRSPWGPQRRIACVVTRPCGSS